MKLFTATCLIAIIPLSFAFSQDFKFGLERTNIDYSLVKKKVASANIFIPETFSLERFSPPAGDQQSLGSCTSWATAYCAMTIVKNVESIGRGAGPFDPNSLHSRLKALGNQNPCSDGNYIEAAATLLKSHGCPKLNDQSCGYKQASVVYDSRLSDFSYLSIDPLEIKSALYHDNSPVVVAANVYHNGWHLDINLEDGVWNGNRGEVFSSHAMVIIGYDNNKAGGSFLIQNSWGQQWGENGRFWIKYSDIQNVIYLAVQFIPEKRIGKNQKAINSNLYQNLVFNDRIQLQDNNMYEKRNRDVIEQEYRFYNNCHLTAYVSLAQSKNGILLTEGWYPIPAGGFADIDISMRDEKEIYWMATAKENQKLIDWTDEYNGKILCIDRLKSHNIQNLFIDCATTAKFIKTIPDIENSITASVLTCPVSQNDSNDYIPQSIEFVVNGNEPLNSSRRDNVILLDYYSSKPILPDKSNSGLDFYIVYYVKDDKIFLFRGNRNELLELKYPKFLSSQNAKAWLEIEK